MWIQKFFFSCWIPVFCAKSWFLNLEDKKDIFSWQDSVLGDALILSNHKAI